MRPDCDAKVRQDSQTTKTSYKKIAEKIYTILFCYIDYASSTLITHFPHYPSGTRFRPFLSPLMAFEGVSCYHRALRSLKYSTIGSCSPSIFRFPRSFLIKRGRFLKKRGRFSEKRWTFSKKRGSFFSAPSEGRFLTANRNTNKTENGRAATLEVQPLIARIDNFQAWTHNYNNITRAQRKLLRCGAGKAIIAAKRSRHTCEIGLFTLEQT